MSTCFTLRAWEGSKFVAADWFGGIPFGGSGGIAFFEAPPTEWQCEALEVDPDVLPLDIEFTIPGGVSSGFWKVCDSQNGRCTDAFEVVS